MIRLIAFFILTALSFQTVSHELSNGYLTLKSVSEDTLSGELLLKPEDIGRVAGLDVNNDGSLTWGEVNRNHNLASRYIQNNVKVSNSGTYCAINLSLIHI